jgi:hypothetical protein
LAAASLESEPERRAPADPNYRKTTKGCAKPSHGERCASVPLQVGKLLCDLWPLLAEVPQRLLEPLFSAHRSPLVHLIFDRLPDRIGLAVVLLIHGIRKE